MAHCDYYIDGPWSAMQEYYRREEQFRKANGGGFGNPAMERWRKENPRPQYPSIKAITEALEALMAVSDAATEENPVGFVLSFPVADGQALYRVDSVKPLILGFIPQGDAYSIPEAHVRGLRREDVRKQIRFRDNWKKLKKNA